MSELALAAEPRGPRRELPTAGAAVGAVGIALPERAVPNSRVAPRLGVDEAWIVARTGVHERRVAEPGQGVVELGAKAADRSLAIAGLDPRELDLVLVATISHDRVTPAAAPLVAARIGAEMAGALDVNAVCSGFVYGLGLATAAVESGRARHVLVVGVDVMSRLIDRDDRSTAPLFGDGAGAVVISRARGRSRIGPVVLGSDGTKGDLVVAAREAPALRMNGPDTFRVAVERLCQATTRAVGAAGRELAEIDAFVYHQANGRILTAVGERLGLSPERVVSCIDRYANTSAATIPIALHCAVEDGLVRQGSQILMAAFGGGLTWGATVCEWGLDASRDGAGHD